MIRLGTRGSALALAQAKWVAERLPDEVEVVPIRTSGDQPSEKGQTPLGGFAGELEDKSRFVKEIEEALLREEIDLAVHSAKDVPAELPDGLAIAAVPERADARDALCGARSLDELREGAIVGTASLRRRALLLALRPDLDVRDLRGNVDTRLRRLAEGDFDAIVLAQAGLQRLGRGDDGEPLASGSFVPAPGQGCLALEARSDDASACHAAAALTDRDALTCLTAERAAVRALGATCRTPVGAHARMGADAVSLSVFVGLPDGSHWIRDELSGDRTTPTELGEQAAGRLRSAGATELLAQLTA